MVEYEYYKPEPKHHIGSLPIGHRTGEQIPWDMSKDGQPLETVTLHLDAWSAGFQHHTVTMHKNGTIQMESLTEGFPAQRVITTLTAKDVSKNPFLKRVIIVKETSVPPMEIPASAAKEAYFMPGGPLETPNNSPYL